MNKDKVLREFVQGKYPQIFCEECEFTFLTNVYSFDEGHVLLEKRTYGLEYYCGAINDMGLIKVPEISPIGVLDEEDNIVPSPSRETIYSGEEPEYRFIYLMDKLEHLEKADIDYFNRCVKDLEWQDSADREKIYAGVARRYDAQLAEDIRKLYEYYERYQSFMAWDLHGDNLMKRIGTGEIVILDPYTRKA